MHHLTFAIASQSHQSTILQILQETQKWLWDQGINQWTLPFEAEWIDESIKNQEFFIVNIQHETAAVFRLTNNDLMWGDTADNAIYIHSLSVQHGWRGHGIGKHILDWIEVYAAQNNRRYLRLDCMAYNSILCRYYQQAGFVKCGLIDIQNDESVYKAQLFEKAVYPPPLTLSNIDE